MRIVGVHENRGVRYVTAADLEANNDELMSLLGQVRAWFTAKERQRLYKNRRLYGVSVARLVLEAAGHPLERSVRGGGGGKYSLADR